MKENECNVFEEKAKQNSEMELKRINEIKEKLECDMNIAAMRFTEYLENDKVKKVKDAYIDMYNQLNAAPG